MKYLIPIRLNWTKVGLKAPYVSLQARSPLRLNWTKVGLKVLGTLDRDEYHV